MLMLNADYKKEEKINGVIYNMSLSPHFRHAIVNNNINIVIGNGLKGSLCNVFIENLDYKYHAEINDDYIIPDIMVVCNRNHFSGSSYTGVPKFVVETLSEGTALRDMTVKKRIYEEAGVNEYWIVSPKERALEIYYLEDEKYVLKFSEALEDRKDHVQYNADTLITLKEFPMIKITLAEIFEGVEK